jgi:hypothetical protein
MGEGLNRVNGEFRANYLAIVAVHTVIRFLHSGWVIPLLIEPGRKLDYPPGTELDTVATALATLFEDMHLATGNLNFFYVKWYPPKCHDPFLRLHQ